MSPQDQFLGPTAPWMQGEEDEYVYKAVMSKAKELLRDRLQQRLSAVAGKPDISQLLLELRREMAVCAVDGDLGASHELVYLYYELIEARENSLRL